MPLLDQCAVPNPASKVALDDLQQAQRVIAVFQRQDIPVWALEAHLGDYTVTIIKSHETYFVGFSESVPVIE